MSNRLLIRCDDLGYSEGVNYGIYAAVSRGIARNVGLMPNMEWAAHGVRLLKDNAVCLGQHTNICAGRPVSNPAQIPSLVDPATGAFYPSQRFRKSDTDFVVLDDAVREVEAQYHRFVELTGRKPDYFEGHAVASENFLRALEIVADRHSLCLEGIKCPDPLMDGVIVQPSFQGTRLKTFMDSMKPDYDPFSTLQKAALVDCGVSECAMMICHPGYLDSYILQNSSLTLPRTLEVTMLTDPAVRDWLILHNIELITFRDLCESVI